MKRFLTVILFLSGIFLLFLGIRYVLDFENEFIRDVLAIVGIILLIGLMLFLILKSKFANRAVSGLLFGNLKNTIESFLNELPNPKNKTIASLSSQLVYRFTRLGIIGLILSSIPIWLLYNQNKILSKQNVTIENQSKLMEKQSNILEIQNERIYQQNLLQEASRRNNLQFEISSILDLIDQELKKDYNNNKKRDLSPELEGRIIALNSRLEPYFFIEGKELIKKPLSQERGQLLLSLINSKLEKDAFRRIVEKMNLNNVDLRNTTITNASLYDLDFSNSDFSNAKFTNTSLSNCYMDEVEMQRITFENCDLTKIFSHTSNWSYSEFKEVKLDSSEILHSNFSNTTFERVNVSGLHLDPINFENSRFDEVIGFDKLYHSNKSVNFKNAKIFISKENIIDSVYTFLSNCNLDKTLIKDDRLVELFKKEKDSFKIKQGNEGWVDEFGNTKWTTELTTLKKTN